jgi:hypothetical protein
MEKNARSLAAMLDALAEVGGDHALFGGLLAGYYGKGRATPDVDLLVSRRYIQPLQAALERRGYEMRRFPFLLKMYVPGEPEAAGDFVVQDSNVVLREAFAASSPGEILGFPVNIVRRGVFVALKFQAAITSIRRLRDRTNDLVDIRGVIEKEFGPDDERLATGLAAKMYPGGAADLKAVIEDVRHGRWPRVARRAPRRLGLLVRRGLAPLR